MVGTENLYDWSKDFKGLVFEQRMVHLIGFEQKRFLSDCFSNGEWFYRIGCLTHFRHCRLRSADMQPPQSSCVVQWLANVANSICPIRCLEARILREVSKIKKTRNNLALRYFEIAHYS